MYLTDSAVQKLAPQRAESGSGGWLRAPPEILAELRARPERENELQRQCGDVRPIIHTDWIPGALS
jgi:hypothetical protein